MGPNALCCLEGVAGKQDFGTLDSLGQEQTRGSEAVAIARKILLLQKACLSHDGIGFVSMRMRK